MSPHPPPTLPLQIHHFIPLAPWTCNKIKGKRKEMHIDSTNTGPSSKYEKKEQIKLVLDMSNDGPMFKMLESMLAGGKAGENGAFGALAKLLKSGIPGLESFFAPGGMGKMSDEDKKRFIAAVTGADGKIDSRAAAALIAAATSWSPSAAAAWAASFITAFMRAAVELMP